MGGCTSSWCFAFATPQVATSIGSIRKWKEMLTLDTARNTFQNDGTVPIGCANGVIELRVVLSEPLLLRPFLQYSCATDYLNLILCWASLMEFRNTTVGDPSRQKQLALDIMMSYVGVGVVKGHHPLPDGLVSDSMRSSLEVFLSSGRGDIEALPRTLFDELLHTTLDAMYLLLFITYRSSQAYHTSVRDMRDSYNHVRANDFIYLEELGRGGFGCVVHCQKKSTGAHYAMKIQTKTGLLECYSPAYERVTCELDFLVSCDSPFVVNLEYAFLSSSLALLVMEIGSAGTLSDSLRSSENRCLSEVCAVFYAAQIVLALEHIHSKGIIYRDLKPSNVLLFADGYIKLADLGGAIDVGGNVSGERFSVQEEGPFGKSGRRGKISRHQCIIERFLSKDKDSQMTASAFKAPSSPSQDEEHPVEGTVDAAQPSRHPSTGGDSEEVVPGTMLRANSVMGTAGFMAPEMMVQLFIDKSVAEGYTKMVDYWSLGVLLYKLLTGLMVFYDDQIASLVSYIRWSHADRAALAPDYLSDFNTFLEVKLGETSGASPETQDFLMQLFKVDQRSRIGAKNGWKDVHKHACFKSVNWRRLYHKRVLPPLMPCDVLPLSGDLQTPVHDSFFDMIMASRRKDWNLSIPHTDLQAHFASWNFVSPDVLRDEVRAESEEHAINILTHRSWALSSYVGSETTTGKSEDMITSIERKCLECSVVTL